MKFKHFLPFIALVIVGSNTRAQDINIDVNQVLSGTSNDVNKYLNEYFKPFGEAQIHNLSRGWFNTGRPHKFLGFDVSVRAQLAIVPDRLQTFTFNKNEYNSFSLEGGATSATLPTCAGGTTTQNIDVSSPITENGITYNGKAQFRAPDGVAEEFKKLGSYPVAIPLPIAQIGIGLIKHTDVKLRYVPKTSLGDDASLEVIGGAVQHEISNYLPFLKKLPFIHFSVLAGYTKTSFKYAPSTNFNGEAVAATNARYEYDISAFTIQGIASAKLAFLELYTAVGYNKGKSNFNVLGSFTSRYKTGLPSPAPEEVSATLTDPVKLSFSGSGVTATAGARLNILFLKIFADYTFGQYKGLGAGLAFSIR